MSRDKGMIWTVSYLDSVMLTVQKRVAAVVSSSSVSRINSQLYSRSTKATTSQMNSKLFDAAVSRSKCAAAVVGF